MKLRLATLVFIAIGAQLSAQDFPAPEPTDAHKLFTKDVGTWDCEVKMFLQGPTGPPAVFKGVETNKLVSGDLFVQTDFTCQMGEREFEGHGLMGYDARSKQYVGTWVDNFTSAPLTLKGTHDAKTGVFTVHSTVVDEAGQEMQQKQTTTWNDDGTKTFKLFLVVEAEGKKVDILLMSMTAKKR